MKVLDRGTWNDKWECRTRCGTCKGLILIEEGDVTEASWQRGLYQWKREICGRANNIEAASIALRVRDDLEKKAKGEPVFGGYRKD